MIASSKTPSVRMGPDEARDETTGVCLMRASEDGRDKASSSSGAELEVEITKDLVPNSGFTTDEIFGGLGKRDVFDLLQLLGNDYTENVDGLAKVDGLERLVGNRGDGAT